MLSLATAGRGPACKIGFWRAAATVLLCSTLASAAQKFPYVPTTILRPELTASINNGREMVYIFQARGDSRVELLSLNISASVDSDTSLETVSTSLPFLDDASETTAFLPSIADNGTIMVQAGDCGSSSGYQIWSYTPSELASDSNDDHSSWARSTASVSSNSDSNTAPHFLSVGISFSSTVAPEMSEPILYSYGGMCASPDNDASSWQSSGTYSDQTVRTARDDDGDYTASVPSGRGPAFPEAGFSFTPLSPSTTNRSGTVSQSRAYVMLGGHTEQAFINMSTAAVWSLPEESWSFLSINPPGDDTQGAELAVKGMGRRAPASNIDSRSGHTAVLNEDGDALIIYGGWVGDVSQPSEPQLAVLSVGNSFGEWEWSIPEDQPEAGIYGHGAVILPGNIMMTYGGYDISASNDKVKRESNEGSPQFLNLTSMSWSSSYANPSISNENGDDSGEDDSDGDDQEYLQRVGIGVGVGVGTAAILGAVLVWLCYRRRLKKSKRETDETVRDLAQDSSRFLHPDEDMMEKNDPWNGRLWYTGGHDPYDNGARSLGYQTLKDSNHDLGGYGDPQSGGLSIPRKPIPRAARGAYQQAPSRPGGLPTPGRIHPIYEADEEDPEEAKLARDPHHAPGTPMSPNYSDPFATPAAQGGHSSYFPPNNRAALTPSPERTRLDPEVQDWQTDVDAAEALLSQMPPRSRAVGNPGRVSPTRRTSMRSNTPGAIGDDERTASGLSDRSFVSSLLSRSGSGAGKTYMPFRPSPTAAGAFMAGGAVATAAVNSDGRLGTSGSSSSGSKETFTTAKTTFTGLQAEGPSLLQRGGDRGQGQRGGSNYPHNDAEDELLMPSSPSKTKPLRNRGWLGSIRRVFSTSGAGGREGGSSSDSSSDSLRSISPIRRASLDGRESPSYQSPLAGLTGMGGAELLRRKQGRRAWDDPQQQHQHHQQPQHQLDEEKRPAAAAAVAGAAGNAGTEGGEDDWDIEKAIEKRLVQVMFTVPRERLRVVNGDAEELDRQEEEAVVVDSSPEAAAASQPKTSPDTSTSKSLDASDAIAWEKSVADPSSGEERGQSDLGEPGSPSPAPLRIQKGTMGSNSTSAYAPEVSPEATPSSTFPPSAAAPAVDREHTASPDLGASAMPNCGPAPLPTPAPTASSIGGTTKEQYEEDLSPWAPARGRTLHVPTTTAEGNGSGDHPGRLSPGQSPGRDSFSDSVSVSEPRPSLTLRTAEEVRFERPKTRVLEMVESFEGRSRESSPSKSPRSAGTWWI